MSVVDQDRAEHYAAALYDNRPTRRIAGLPHDAERVPDRADLEDER